MEIRTPQNLGAAARGRRRALHLSQAKVAKTAGVSRPWLSEFESGKPTVEVGRVLAVLNVLDLALDVRPTDAEPTNGRRTADDPTTCWISTPCSTTTTTAATYDHQRTLPASR
jgi:HTH-type transcriptional regulator / antitoxin HipB